MLKYLLVFTVITLYVFLFKKASGTLKPNLMNVVTFVFFSILGFELIGGSLVYLGFDDHYLIKKISSNVTINKTYYILAYTSLILPLTIIFFNKFVYKIDKSSKQKRGLEEAYLCKLKENVQVEDKKQTNRLYICLIILSIVCLLSIIYVFVCIGYMPLLQYFNSDLDLATERIKISRNFSGNEYVKNLIMLSITPAISYVAYIYMRKTKEKKWKSLFFCLFILSVLALTYNFEKSPIIYYIIFFFIIEVVLGNTFNFKRIIPFFLVCVAMIAFLYKAIMGYSGPIFSLSSGPVGRIFITQVATLFLHIDAFPEKTGYLCGHSFPKELLGFLGDGTYDVRSGRKIIEIYSKEAVANGSAGVMNTLFVGEAYANFGIIGAIIAPILVGIIFSSVLAYFLKVKKTPLNIIIYLELFIVFTGVLQGGIVDFFYNIKLFVIMIVILSLKHCMKFDKLWDLIKLDKKIFKEKETMIDNTKRCIYHLPNYIEPGGRAGSKVRPMKMLQAFKNIGYEVDFIMGYGKERKKKIKEIKKKIKSGIKYDFLYSENSTMPTLLTEKNHLPTYPFLDFGFMKFCKKRGIKIGLYYRDIYWKFPFYKNEVKPIKRFFALLMYNYDFYKYYQLLDRIYIQSIGMRKYFPAIGEKIKVDILPPGSEKKENIILEKREQFSNIGKYISVFYVGGVGNLYNLENLLTVINKKDYLKLTICCRKEDWEKEQKRYEKYLNGRVSIVHESGEGLEKYYKEADLCSIYFPPEEYRNFVMPIKLFEYLGHVTPILATANTATGDFVRDNDIGWAIESDNELEEVFDKIYNNKEELINKYYNLVKTLEKNTWEERAKKVKEDLIGEERGKSDK